MNWQKIIIQKPNFKSFMDKTVTPPWAPRGIWPCKWIWAAGECCDQPNEPIVLAFRKIFKVQTSRTIRIHVSADERYILYLDGQRIGRGPERGDVNNWFYETFDIEIDEGSHVFVAKVLADRKNSAWTQTSVRNGFLLATEDAQLFSDISTGVAQWQCTRIKGVEQMSSPINYNATGSRLRIDGFSYPWGIENGGVDVTATVTAASFYWCDAISVEEPVDSTTYHVIKDAHKLTPATLPEMLNQQYSKGQIVFKETLPYEFNWSDLRTRKLEARNNQIHGSSALSGLTIAPNSNVRFLIDLGDYCCYYPQIQLTGGSCSEVRFGDTEALFELGEDPDGEMLKGQRDQFLDKVFISDADYFTTDGNTARQFETLWWRTGRFVEICVKTKDEALSIDHILFYETRYPFHPQSTFVCSDKSLNGLIPISLRSIEMCSHETYMDCPFYEQLMYIGDTRIQALVTYAYSNDYRLAKKALNMFVQGMNNHIGVPNCAYPSSGGKIIPSFCLWLIGMAHDYVKWVGDLELVKGLMPSLRKIVDTYYLNLSDNGLIKTPPGWNYVDWVDDKVYKDWFYGEPNDSKTGFLSLFNLQMVHVLEVLSDLEELCGELELAERATRRAKQLFKATDEAFWDEGRQIYADDLLHKFFCEQTQVLALLCECIDEERTESRSDTGADSRPDARIESLQESRSNACAESRADALERAIQTDSIPIKCSIYFSYYLFEVLKKRRNARYLFKRLKDWEFVQELNFSTTPEVFQTSTRSDCHAWGAHPAFHFLTAVLGISPDGVGFEKVRIEPMLGDLDFAEGTMVHPLGDIIVSIKKLEAPPDSGMCEIVIELPEGLTGSFIMSGQKRYLSSGTQHFSL